jgi:hypothetical protein
MRDAGGIVNKVMTFKLFAKKLNRTIVFNKFAADMIRLVAKVLTMT